MYNDPAQTRLVKLPQSVFLKKHSQVIYAVILIILIPLVIIGNTLFVIKRFEGNIDSQLQRQALIIAEIFDATAFNSLSDIDRVQGQIQKLAEGPEELRSFDIMVPDPDGEAFRIVASSFTENLDQTNAGINNILAWSNDRGIAHLSRPSLEDIRRDPDLEGARFWNVVFPLHDESGQKIALLNLKMSLKITDALFRQALIGSTMLLLLTLIIVLGLLLINTRLFQYAVLFRKLEEVDQMKDEFISMASHELRSPITAIRGYVSMFLEGSFGTLSEQGMKGLTIVDASARRLGDLVEDLLDVSRIEQSRIKLSLEPVNLKEVIDQTIQEMSIMATRKNLTLSYKKPDAALPPVAADKDKLRQVIINLLGNAIKYTRKGAVTVTTEVREKDVRIKIKDTGVGIAAPDREKLFNKFYRVKNESTKGITGTGLGLWITKQLVELMGGTIGVDSIENVGTEVGFTIPRSKQKIPVKAEGTGKS